MKACREAKANGADIALFPEMWSSGYTFPHNKEWLEQNSISLNSKYVKQFSEISLKLNMAIAITLLEKHEPKPRNTVCLFDRHGKLVYCYSKVHICETDETEKILLVVKLLLYSLSKSFIKYQQISYTFYFINAILNPSQMYCSHSMTASFILSVFIHSKKSGISPHFSTIITTYLRRRTHDLTHKSIF